MTNIDALVATNLWWTERKEKGVHHYILRTIPLLFQTLDALYIETRRLPLTSISGRRINTVSESYTITYGIFLKPGDYAAMRSILSLSGDIYEMLHSLKKLEKKDLLELDVPIKKLYNYSLTFKEIRDMFTHLGEALTDMQRHGISGPESTQSGITYSASAKHCIHLVWDVDTIYFTHRKNEYKITINRLVYDPLFQIAREIYKEITSNEINKGKNNYIPLEKLYPEVSY